MDIVPSCVLCGNSFTPRRHRQKYCPSCIEQSHTCTNCGAIKHRSVRTPLCKKCFDITRIGTPNFKNRREEKPIEQVISEVEAFGLLPEKQYAFGYVIGVIFGDGSVSKSVHRNLKRSDGAPRVRPVVLYRMRLQVTSQAFAERFAKQWEILTGKMPNVWETIRTDFSKSTLKGRREGYTVRLFNVGTANVLLGRYLAYLKYESDPLALSEWPIETTQGFIDGMIDSEGYVCEAYTDIANKNIALLEALAAMLKRLGYPAKIYTSPSQKIAHLRTAPYRAKYERLE